MKYSLAIFDLDGTLLNTLDDLTDAGNFALESFGLPVRSPEEVRAFVGNGIRKLVERSVPENTPSAIVQKVYEAFMSRYAGHSRDKTAPYAGIRRLLSSLKAGGPGLAVISNKTDGEAKKLVEYYFPQTFDFIAGEREGIRKKPAPDAVNEALKQLCVNRDKCVYIGDSEVDIHTAENAGTECISVSWGFRDKSRLKELTNGIIADTPEELLGYLL